MRAAIAERGGAEDRVDGGVRDHVRVREAFEAAFEWNAAAAQNQRAPGNQTVRVKPETDSQRRVASRRSAMRAATSKSSGVVILRFSYELSIRAMGVLW